MKNRWMGVIVAISLLVLALGSGQAAPTATSPRGTLRVAASSFSAESPALWQGENTLLVYSGPLYDPLIAADDNGGLSKKGIISDWQSNPAGDQVTLRVRPGVKFHNGDEVTAEDIKFTFATYIRPEVPGLSASGLRPVIDRVEVVDKYRARVFLKQPNSFFPHLLAWVEADIGVLPKRYFESLPGTTFQKKEAEFAKRPIGTGPYKFVKREKGVSIEFVANEDYFDKEHLPKFKRVIVLLASEISTRANMLRTGQADLVALPAEQAIQLQKEKFGLHFVKNVSEVGLIFLKSYDPAMIHHDIRIRKALTLAVDRRALAKAIWPDIPGIGPLGTVADGPFMAGPGVAGYRPDLPSYPYNPTEARRLLEQAGYYKNPKTLVIHPVVFAGIEESRQVSEAVAEYWKAVGVKVELQPMDLALLLQKLGAKPQNFSPPGAVMPATVVGYSGINNWRNFGSVKYGFTSVYPNQEEADRWYLDIRSTMDPKQFEEKMYQLWKNIFPTYWAIPLVWRGEVWAYNPKVLRGWNPVTGTSLYLRYETAVPAPGVR